MGISGGTGVGGGAQPPGIEESLTQAFVEVTKKNVLAMIPAESMEVIPFTQREYDEVFKYKSEPGRPSLHPLLFARTSAGGEISEEENWQPAYQKLLNALPEVVKEWITDEMKKPFNDRDPAFVAVNHLMTTVAKTIGWLEHATRPIQPGSTEERYFMRSLALPYVAINGSLSLSERIMEVVQFHLETTGPNNPIFDRYIKLMDEITDMMSELNDLRIKIAKENMKNDDKRRLEQLANQLFALQSEFHASATESDLHIVGAALDAMCVAAEAWSTTSTSPSLHIGLNIATMGILLPESETGIVDENFKKIMQAILDGLVGALSFGTRAHIGELRRLHDDLTELRGA